MHYDLAVIGSGPAGQKGAIAAAKLGKRVALIERQMESIGGVCVNTGTIPSKTIREAILHLTGFRQRDVYGEQFRRKRHITMDDLRLKLDQVVRNEHNVIEDQLDRNGIDVFAGNACFIDSHSLRIHGHGSDVSISADQILIASGTKPARPEYIPFDRERVFDSDDILSLDHIPRSMIVVGGGVIGIEYGLMFATLGVRVTVIDGRKTLLEFVDREIVDSLIYHARSLGVVFRLGEHVENVERCDSGRVAVRLESQKRVIAETVLFCAGRTGDTEELQLVKAGLEPDSRGRISCNEEFRTEVPHIFAVGDVVGFPALASTSMEQGRKAVAHAFGQPFEPLENVPYGLFTIPEISMVGETEEALTEQKTPYEIGIAHFSEIARGQIAGDHVGLLKLLCHRETRKILGVHCIGEAATEIIHIGQVVMAFGGTIEYFTNTVFNYPTMAECYKVAAFDAISRLAWDPVKSNDIDLDAALQTVDPPPIQAVTVTS